MALSASKIADFYLCIQKFRTIYITKEVAFVETAETKDGKLTHSALELGFKTNGESLKTESYPLLESTKKLLLTLLAAEGQKYAEYKFGITDTITAKGIVNNWDKQPDGNPFLLTGAMDVRIVNGEYTTIIDYKTGKDYPDPEEVRNKPYTKHLKEVELACKDKTLQLDVYAFAEFLLRPECNYIKGVYYFTKSGKPIEKIYVRDKDFEKIKNYILEACNEIYKTIESYSGNEDYYTKISPLCGWCGYRDRCNKYKEHLKAKESSNG